MTATQPSPRRAQAQATGPIHRLVIVHGPDGVGRSLVLGDAPVVLGRAGEGPLALADDELSRQHARFVVGEVGDLDSTNGTFVDGQPISHAALRDGSVVRAGQTLLLYEVIEARSQDRFEPPSAGLLGPSPAMQRVRGEVSRVARHTVSVLIQGETGVGKERVAEAIHQASGRRGAFVPVNCAALPAELVESELFGHVAGAFSGARAAHDGLFLAASGGTLFLDEIGEMPLALQPKLLRALSTGSIRAVGATSARPVDVRVIAATHRDVLEAALSAGSFRADLYARLAGWVIQVPPLRTRRGDVLPLARATLARLRGPAHLTADAAEALLLAPWPFNVRGLEQAMTAAAVRADGADAVDVGHLDAALAAALGPRGTSELPVAVPLALRVPPDVTPDASQLLEVLAYFDGNVAEVARFFGKDRRQIYRWADRLGVDVDAARGAP
ncbi:MAG: sigma 54-interacting transcriptional regulator [bacterium]